MINKYQMFLIMNKKKILINKIKNVVMIVLIAKKKIV